MLITKIGASYTESDFPELFSNQVYLSKNTNLGGYKYESSFSIKYVLSGKESYSVNGREFIIKPGEHLLVNNKSVVETLPANGQAISIFIDPLTFRDIHNFHNSTDYFDTQDQSTNSFVIFENVFNHENPRINKQLMLIAKLLHQNLNQELEMSPALFFDLSEALYFDQVSHSKRLKNIISKKKATKQEQYTRLLKGIEFLRDNWDSPYSLMQTSNAAALSPYHFHRLFRLCFNKTPYEYLLDIQMKKALELLKEDISISDVSSKLGFNDITSFGRTFKKHFGCSSSQYRKKQYL